MDQPGYKSKLKELQANIKRSKLEHRELEYEFQKLMIQRNDCDRSAMKTFRNKYNSVLEEDKRRIARNEKIKQMLERIDYQAAALAAKSERLKMLKAHYEKNLYRAFGPNSSRTDDDNSSDRYIIAKQRTKSVDAHTQIPRPNYEVFNVEDALNSRNYAPTIREPRSVSTSRINREYHNSTPNYDQRPTKFNSDIISDEIQRGSELTPTTPAANKGVRLFYGHELMNLPNLKVTNDVPVQDSKVVDQIFKQHEVRFEDPVKPIYQTSVDRMYENLNPQVGTKNLESSERSNDQNSSQYQETNYDEDPLPMTQPPHFQYPQNNNISSFNQEAQRNKPIINTRPNTEYQNSAQNSNPMIPARHAPQSQYQTNKESLPPYSQHEGNNITESTMHYSSPSNPVANPSYLQNSENNSKPPLQNQPVTAQPYPETRNALHQNFEVATPNNYRPQTSFTQESDDGFTANTIPEVKPIAANQIDVVQLNKPSSPTTPQTQVREVPSNLPQGIHQVWEKVVDVEEIVNSSPKPPPYPIESNEPRNDVIDKIYKEISSLGEAPTDDGQNDGTIKQSEIIDQIEEHYYGEKIKSDDNDSAIYSNTNVNDQHYELTDQSQILAEQNNDYTIENQVYQDPNINYVNPDPNDPQPVEYQNYDLNGQQYYSEPQVNYATDQTANYNMEQPMDDQSYNYAQNENYQNYDQTGYVVEQGEPQNYIANENQQQPQEYTDQMHNEYYEQQQSNEQQYEQNPSDLGQQYTNEVYDQNINYDQQNMNTEQYPVQYNETAPQMYQEYSTDQQPQLAESTIPYDQYTDYTQNEQPSNADPIEIPLASEPEEMSVNQDASSLSSSVEQPTPLPNNETTNNKSPDEIKSAVAKPQGETKKKRVNFLDSSDSEQPSVVDEKQQPPKMVGKDQSDSDFEFSVKSN